MQAEILIAGLGSIILITYSLSQWALNGEWFHPAFIYSILNGGIFIVFVFGPYIYTYEIPPYYYFMYILLLYTFVGGIIWGCAVGRRRQVKEVRFKPREEFIIYLLSVFLSIIIAVPLIVSSRGNLEEAVVNRFEALEIAGDQSNSNPLMFVVSNLSVSFRQVSTALITSYTFLRGKNYHRVALLFVVLSLISIFSNSRTLFLFSLLSIGVPGYIVLKEKGLIDFSKISWSKNLKYTIPMAAITIVIIGVLTNIRGIVRSGSLEARYENLERLLEVERKDWFEPLNQIIPESLMNVIAEMSLYTGGTVACGGAVTGVALNLSLNTWGIRTINPIYRIVDRLGLARQILEMASQNLDSILSKLSFVFAFWWWGDPANFMVDYGIILSPFISITIGWTIGWMYGCLSKSSLIIKATGTSIIFNAMLLTPATSPFSFFSNFFNLSLLIIYLLKSSQKLYKIRHINKIKN